jgi:AbrB family looped-hinge helix DNA binding protein
MPGIMTKTGKNGRVVIPAEFRKKMGLKPGDRVVVYFEDDEIHVSTSDRIIKRTQEEIKKYIPADRDLVAELIRDRREEAARE